MFTQSNKKTNIIDITRETNFTVNITKGNENFSVEWGFWRETINDNLYIYCNINEDINEGNYTINFNGLPYVIYQDYNITFKQERDLEFEKLDMDIVDLYSVKQKIEIEKNVDTYKLNFKIVSYNQQKIFLGIIPLDCQEEKSDLICDIKKSDLEVILADNISKLPVSSFQRKFPLIPSVSIIYNYTQKTDVYIGITKLIENVSEHDTLIAYETNVTDISNVITNSYDTTIGERIELEFYNENNETKRHICHLRKYDATPLLMVCWVGGNNVSWLKEIENEQIYNNLNIRYNFRILPVINEEKIYYEPAYGDYITRIYPQVLDFRKNDNLFIDYIIEDLAENVNGITFNENKPDLSCEIMLNEFKRCYVPKSHFEGKEGYYFTKHTNHLGNKSTNYEAPPVKVILYDPPTPSNDSHGNLKLYIYYSLLLILIMV